MVQEPSTRRRFEIARTEAAVQARKFERAFAPLPPDCERHLGSCADEEIQFRAEPQIGAKAALRTVTRLLDQARWLDLDRDDSVSGPRRIAARQGARESAIHAVRTALGMRRRKRRGGRREGPRPLALGEALDSLEELLTRTHWTEGSVLLKHRTSRLAEYWLRGRQAMATLRQWFGFPRRRSGRVSRPKIRGGSALHRGSFRVSVRARAGDGRESEQRAISIPAARSMNLIPGRLPGEPAHEAQSPVGYAVSGESASPFDEWTRLSQVEAAIALSPPLVGLTWVDVATDTVPFFAVAVGPLSCATGAVGLIAGPSADEGNDGRTYSDSDARVFAAGGPAAKGTDAALRAEIGREKAGAIVARVDCGEISDSSAPLGQSAARAAFYAEGNALRAHRGLSPAGRLLGRALDWYRFENQNALDSHGLYGLRY